MNFNIDKVTIGYKEEPIEVPQQFTMSCEVSQSFFAHMGVLKMKPRLQALFYRIRYVSGRGVRCTYVMIPNKEDYETLIRQIKPYRLVNRLKGAVQWPMLKNTSKVNSNI